MYNGFIKGEKIWESNKNLKKYFFEDFFQILFSLSKDVTKIAVKYHTETKLHISFENCKWQDFKIIISTHCYSWNKLIKTKIQISCQNLYWVFLNMYLAIT